MSTPSLNQLFRLWLSVKRVCYRHIGLVSDKLQCLGTNQRQYWASVLLMALGGALVQSPSLAPEPALLDWCRPYRRSLLPASHHGGGPPLHVALYGLCLPRHRQPNTHMPFSQLTRTGLSSVCRCLATIGMVNCMSVLVWAWQRQMVGIVNHASAGRFRTNTTGNLGIHGAKGQQFGAWLGAEFLVVTGAALWSFFISLSCAILRTRFVWLVHRFATFKFGQPWTCNFQSFNSLTLLWLSLYTAASRWESRSHQTRIPLKTFSLFFLPWR